MSQSGPDDGAMMQCQCLAGNTMRCDALRCDARVSRNAHWQAASVAEVWRMGAIRPAGMPEMASETLDRHPRFVFLAGVSPLSGATRRAPLFRSVSLGRTSRAGLGRELRAPHFLARRHQTPGSWLAGPEALQSPALRLLRLIGASAICDRGSICQRFSDSKRLACH